MYERILAAVDESQMAEHVLVAARELAAIANGEVFVLHVWEAEPSRSKASTVMSYEDARMLVTAAAEKLGAAGVRATGEVAANLYSNAAFEITSYAKAQNAGVIIIGSCRRNDLTALVAGSTAHKVVRTGDRPVVVVP